MKNGDAATNGKKAADGGQDSPDQQQTLILDADALRACIEEASKKLAGPKDADAGTAGQRD